jgi:hypothetical protein
LQIHAIKIATDIIMAIIIATKTGTLKTTSFDNYVLVPLV